MKPTIDQLNALSDYEINCAVAEKLGLYLVDRCVGFKATCTQLGKSKDSVLTSKKKDGYSVRIKDYCLDPCDYMPIAIEHGISIVFNQEEVETDYSKDFDQYVSDYYTVKSLPKTQTGRAICIAFLLMNQEPV